jgi:hypothetical protein
MTRKPFSFRKNRQSKHPEGLKPDPNLAEQGNIDDLDAKAANKKRSFNVPRPVKFGAAALAFIAIGGGIFEAIKSFEQTKWNDKIMVSNLGATAVIEKLRLQSQPKITIKNPADICKAGIVMVYAGVPVRSTPDDLSGSVFWQHKDNIVETVGSNQELRITQPLILNPGNNGDQWIGYKSTTSPAVNSGEFVNVLTSGVFVSSDTIRTQTRWVDYTAAHNNSQADFQQFTKTGSDTEGCHINDYGQTVTNSNPEHVIAYGVYFPNGTNQTINTMNLHSNQTH